MLRGIRVPTITVCLLLVILLPLYAQEGMPPAQVVVTEAETGMVAPESEYIGTVYYHEVSEVACELSGKVENINFEEGQRVEKGAVLVTLNSDLLLSDLQKAELNFRRADRLHKENLISEEAFDERRFEVERLRIELDKKKVESPFDGVVIKKHVDRGEWLSPGSVVATIADDTVIEITTEVPERIIGFIDEGMKVTVQVGGSELTGEVSAVIRRGDITTRTFPVKIRVDNSLSLIEGMAARVILPAGEKVQALTVPRDAVISMFGMTVVFVVIDSQAKMIPVQVAGYKGLQAGIFTENLSAGDRVVIKGNERLRDGQEVIVH